MAKKSRCCVAYVVDLSSMLECSKKKTRANKFYRNNAPTGSSRCREVNCGRRKSALLLSAVAAISMKTPLRCSAFDAIRVIRHTHTSRSRPIISGDLWRQPYHIMASSSIYGRRNGCMHPSAQHSHLSKITLLSLSTPSDDATTRDIQTKRIKALHQELSLLGIDADELASAANRSIKTTEGFDPKYGKPAIKTYRTYVNPGPSKVDIVKKEDAEVAAARCARQIDFLAKRHRSHEADWIRHTDTVADGDDIQSKSRFPLLLVLDNVRSAFNVGSIFRTADACACAEIITTGITPHPNGSGAEKLAKSALGADRVVPSRHFATTMEAVQYLRNKKPGVMLVGMETTKLSKCYTDVIYPGGATNEKMIGRCENGDSTEAATERGTALFLGNEVTGVDTEVLPLLDVVVEIPMFGTKNSLNIAACAPVVMYEILRQWSAIEEEGTE